VSPAESGLSAVYLGTFVFLPYFIIIGLGADMVNYWGEDGNFKNFNHDGANGAINAGI
jgi:hypothetical protein